MVKKVKKHSTTCIILIAKNTYCRKHLLQKSLIAENHLRFQGYIPVSSVAVDITMDEFNSSMLV
jgi:uncharacterized protein (DUF2384 family)